MQHRNRRSRRQFMQLAGIGAASALVLAACSAPAAAPAGGSSGGAPAEEKVVLTFGHHWEAAFRSVQEEFDKKYADAKASC